VIIGAPRRGVGPEDWWRDGRSPFASMLVERFLIRLAMSSGNWINPFLTFRHSMEAWGKRPRAMVESGSRPCPAGSPGKARYF